MTILATIALLVAATIDKGPYIIVNTIVTGGMWALMSMGLALVFGVMNIPHFAMGEIFMAGGLVAFSVATPLNDYLSKHPNPIHCQGWLPSLLSSPRRLEVTWWESCLSGSSFAPYGRGAGNSGL